MTPCQRSLLGILAAGAIVLLASGCAGGRRSGASDLPASMPPPAPSPTPAPAAAAAPGDTLNRLPLGVVASLQAGAPQLLEGGVLFTFVSRRARSVAVAGTFNGWVPNSYPLVRRQPSSAAPPAAGASGVRPAEAPADSLWYALVPVARGRHSYKYLVDGNRWLADPQNARQTSDGGGGVASVLVVP